MGRINKTLQELCECAFQQGYGDIAKKSPGVYLPHIPWNIYDKPKNISQEDDLE